MGIYKIINYGLLFTPGYLRNNSGMQKEFSKVHCFISLHDDVQV